MDSMFAFTSGYDEPLLGWDTSSVVVMDGMFRDNLDFNSDISFDTSSVTSMNSMFLLSVSYP